MERSRWSATTLVLAFLVSVSWADGVGAQVPPCGDANAPLCKGECPAGTRCTDTTAEIFGFVRSDETMQPATTAKGQSQECACLEVPCGGVPLEDGQGCCNGQPYELGSQFCCNGTISTSPICECGGQVVQLAADTTCCEIDPTTPLIVQGLNAAACCSNPSGEVAFYTYNLPFDCCSGETCGGTCQQGECVGKDCCVCEPFPDSDEPPPVCAAADSDLGCLAACFFNGDTVGFFCPPELVDLGDCDEASTRAENEVCTDNGCATPTPTSTPTATPTVTSTATSTPTATPTNTRVPEGGSCTDTSQCAQGLFCLEQICTDVTSPAPPTSTSGLLVAIVGLIAIGGFALLRRRKLGHYFTSLWTV